MRAAGGVLGTALTTPLVPCLQVNYTSALQAGQWYKLGIAQKPFPGGPTVAAAAPSSSLVGSLTNMFSNPVLQAVAATAAESIWSIVPPGTLARAGSPTPAAAVAAAAAAGTKPLPPLLIKSAEYAPALLYTHMLADGEVALPPRPAMAAGGTIDAYLCECSRVGRWLGVGGLRPLA